MSESLQASVRRFVASIKKNYNNEWIGWPAWTITCFFVAVILCGVFVAGCGLIGLKGWFETTLGSLALSTLIYVFLAVLLLSISRMSYAQKMPQRLTGLIIAIMPAFIIGGLYAVHAINSFVAVLLAIVAGFIITLSSIPVKRRAVTLQGLGIARPLSWSDIGLGIAGYAIYLIVFIAISAALVQLVPGYNADQAQDLGFTMLFGVERTIAFIVLVVVAPLAEEFVMRGFLFGKLRKAKMPFWPAAIAVSIIFGAAHGQWNVGIDTFILSLVACYLRESTGTIWPGVIIHMAKNALAFIFLFVIGIG